jgi:hypothetical protein
MIHCRDYIGRKRWIGFFGVPLGALVLALFCLPAISCDFSQGLGDGKGFLTITLPGATAPDLNRVAARAVHLPEEVTGPMNYSLEFYGPGGYFSVGPTREKEVTVELEPGYWDIVATAWYGSAVAARDKKPQVEIRAGRENSVSFTMNADEFITPDIPGWTNQDKTLTTSDDPEILGITLAGTTAFSGISGWTDSFTYQGYYEDTGGNRTNIDGSPVPFSGPGETGLSYRVDPAALGEGIFAYYLEITNSFTYTSPSGGETATGSAAKDLHVARITVTDDGTNLPLTGITIGSPPAKTVYTIGDAFSSAGLIVNAVYDDGSSAAVPGWTLSWNNAPLAEGSSDITAAVGSQTVTVAYEDKTTTFTVTVNGIATLISITFVDMPEEITDQMTYSLDFYRPGKNFSVGPTQEKAVTVELEPGYWDIVAFAEYNSIDAAAWAKKPQMEIRAGQANSVSLTMNVDESATPNRSGWANQDKYVGTTNPPPSLSVTMNTFTVFSSEPGWSDNFSYAWYYEDTDENRTPSASGTFSFSPSPGTVSLSSPVVNGTPGTFYYYVEISNAYTYTPGGGGTPTSGTATRSFPVANVEVFTGTSYSVGNTGPDGGTVFYVSSAGFISNGVTCHYLEVAPSDEPLAEWGASGTSVGGTGDAIGTGYDNTQAIITALIGLGESGRAAQLASAYTGGSFYDWFLPSKAELEALYSSGLSGLSPSIWSSTEVNAGRAYSVGNAGAPGYWSDFKTGTLTFRPVRAF